MDIDALRQSHKDQWERLGKLASKRILSAKETDELISLYGQVGQQLSAVRSQAPTLTQLWSSVAYYREHADALATTKMRELLMCAAS